MSHFIGRCLRLEGRTKGDAAWFRSAFSSSGGPHLHLFFLILRLNFEDLAENIVCLSFPDEHVGLERLRSQTVGLEVQLAQVLDRIVAYMFRVLLFSILMRDSSLETNSLRSFW